MTRRIVWNSHSIYQLWTLGWCCGILNTLLLIQHHLTWSPYITCCLPVWQHVGHREGNCFSACRLKTCPKAAELHQVKLLHLHPLLLIHAVTMYVLICVCCVTGAGRFNDITFSSSLSHMCLNIDLAVSKPFRLFSLPTSIREEKATVLRKRETELIV